MSAWRRSEIAPVDVGHHADHHRVQRDRRVPPDPDVTISVPIPADMVDPSDPFSADWRGIMQDYIASVFPDAEPSELRQLGGILSNGAQFQVRDAVVDDPSLIGETLTITVPVSDPFDQLAKGYLNRDAPEDERRLNDLQISAYDQFERGGCHLEPDKHGAADHGRARGFRNWPACAEP